ncbi:SagB/ThcOx family dehydrogenase [Thermodesulfobacteriota bacterium]
MIITASQYHKHTSYERDELGGHYLDWQNRPGLYKDYPGIEPIALPEKLSPIKKNLHSILKETDIDYIPRSINIEDLSLILRLTYSLTAKASHSGADFYYRSAASAGALYPTEIYAATHGIDGLDDGLYHYAIHRHGLSLIRNNDLSNYIAGLFIPPAKREPMITFFFTAIFFRSAWKYRDRSYRYHLLDTGHVVENLVLAFKALGLPLNLSYDFDDGLINHLLGLKEAKEVALAVARIPGSDFITDSDGPEIDELSEDFKNTSMVSGKEVDYPIIREIHQESEKTISKEDYGPEMINNLGLVVDTWEKLPDLSFRPEHMDYPQCVFNRRSSRNFIKEPIRKEYLFPLLDALCVDDIYCSGNGRKHSRALCVGFFINNIEGVSSGVYLLDNMKRRFGLINPGSFMDSMAHACLDQAWLGNAAVLFLFMNNLDILDGTWGPRGYRYAMMSAGRMGERLYITATSLGLGCCGIGAFYDGEAAELIGLNSEFRLLYLVATGRVKSLIDR